MHEATVAQLQGNGNHYEVEERQLLAGGGSVAACGLQMSAERNRSAALSIEPEIDVFLSWIQQETTVDAAVAGKLWDGVTWHRPVMNGSNAFTVPDCFFSMCNAGHVPDLYDQLLHGDAFGLRQRLTVLFAWPTFDDDNLLNRIKRGCAALPVPSKDPSDFIAALLFPLMNWSLFTQHCNSTTFNGRVMSV